MSRPLRALSLALLLLLACTDPSHDMALSDRDQLTLQIVAGIAPPLGDPATIRSARVEGDRLVLETQFGGGCRTHRFAVVTDGVEGLSLPPFYVLYLAHDAGGDLCEALLTRRLVVDLRPLREIAGPGGSVLLHLRDPEGAPALDALSYEF